MGWVRVIQGKTVEAFYYLNQSIQLALRLNDSAFVSDIYERMSLNCENVDSAFLYAHLSHQYLTKDTLPIYGHSVKNHINKSDKTHQTLSDKEIDVNKSIPYLHIAFLSVLIPPRYFLQLPAKQ